MKHLLILLTATIAFASTSQNTSAQMLLAVDVNDRTVGQTPNTVPGFLSYTMPGTQTVGTYSVTLAAFDDHLDQNSVSAGVQDTTGAIDDRDRGLPINGGSLTYAQIYDDFVFAGASTGPSGGIDLTVSGGDLLPNMQYSISIYAFDSESKLAPQPRSANWFDGNNGDTLVLATAFAGSSHPTTDTSHRFTGLAMTDGTGTILLKGRNTSGYETAGGVAPGVFVNGFEIHQVPEPSTVCLALVGFAALGLRLRRR